MDRTYNDKNMVTLGEIMNLIFAFLFMLCCYKDNSTSKTDANETTEQEQNDNNGNKPFQRSPNRVEAKIGPSQPTSRVKGTIIERHKLIGNTPEDAIGLWIEATIRIQQGDETGWDALGELTIDGYTKKKLNATPNWQRDIKSYFKKKLNSKDPCFRSLIIGATPSNNYDVELNDIRIHITRNAGTDVNGNKYFVKSSGAQPRPIYLKQSDKTGLLYVTNYSSMYVDVQKPQNIDEEKFK